MSGLPVLELDPLPGPPRSGGLPVLELDPITPTAPAASPPQQVQPSTLPVLELDPIVAAPAPAPVSGPAQFIDPMSGMPMAAPPVPSLAQTVTPMGDRDLEGQRARAMADPVSLGERFALNAGDAYYGGTLSGSGQLVELQRAARMSPQEWAEYNAAVRYAGGALKPLPSPAEAQAEIQRIAGARARYEAMPWSGGPLEFGAAIGGQLAGSLPSPESFITTVPGVGQGIGAVSRAAPVIGRTVERAVGEGGQAVAGRMLESGLSQGVINTAVDPLAQVGSIQTGMQPGYDPLRTALAFPIGVGLGAGLQGGTEAAAAGVRRLLPTPVPEIPRTPPDVIDLAARGQLAPTPIVGAEFATERAGVPAVDPSLSTIFTPPQTTRTVVAPEQFPPTAAAPPAGEPYAQTVVPSAEPVRPPPSDVTAVPVAPVEPRPAPAAQPAPTGEPPSAAAVPPVARPTLLSSETLPAGPGPRPPEIVPPVQSTGPEARPAEPVPPSPRPPVIGEPVDRPGAAAGRPGEPAPVGEGGLAPVAAGPGEIPGGARLGAGPGERPGDTEAARGEGQPTAQPVVPAGEARPTVGAEPPVRATPEAPAAEAPPVARLTTEPDDVVPGQHVAKNPSGEVVGKGATPEAATADAQRRSGTPYAPEAPAKRPVTKAELEALDKRARDTGYALTRAERDPNTPPERLATLRQRADEAAAARRNAEGPPGRPYYKVGLSAKEMTAEHQRLTGEHEAAIDRRVHAEGTDPTPEPAKAGAVFRMGEGGSGGVVSGVDARGNTWVGTGSVLAKGDTLARAAAQEGKKKTAGPTRPVTTEALTKVTTPDPKVTYEPVTWERQITDPFTGNTLVIGTRPDGTHVVLQKPAYDALHAAAGKGGVVVAGPGNDRMFARNAKNQVTGVGMPIRVDEAKARAWARGPERPAIADQAEAPARLEDQAVVPGPREDAGTTGPRTETEVLSGELPDQTPAPTLTTLTTDPTLTRLQATRDALTNKVRSPDEERRLARINQQITRREAALERQAEDRRGGRKQLFTGPPQVGRARDLLDYKFNDGTSVFRSVFEEAGHDPDLAVSFPVKRQAEILTRHVQTKFGFTGVEVVGARGRDATAVDQHTAVQAMLDMTRAMQDGMASLGLPHEAASLNGHLRLVIEPESKPGPFGAYVSDGTIRIRGGANSYGHEWTHAIDHMLSERFTGNPAQMNKLLSQYARDSGLDTSDNVQAAFAKLINTMFYEDTALATRRLALETQAAKVDKQGNSTKGALAAQDQLVLLEGAGSKLRIQSSEFRRESAAFHPPKADYWASVYEMLARAHEAYIARQMQQHGVDPRGIVMPDEAYINMVDRQLKMAYPKQADRIAIFQAFDELHHAMRREQVLANGKPPGDFSDLGISDPHHHRITAPGGGRTTMGQRVRAEINSYKNFTQTLAERAGLFDKDRPQAPRPLSTRFADGARAVYKSTRGMMNIIVDRAPPEAKAILQPIMDSLATAPGKGRQTPENFEEAVHRQTRQWNFQYGNILENNGFHEYNRMTTEERQMLRHVLVTGERTMPVDPTLSSAGAVPISDNIVKVAGSLRQLLDQTWRTSHDAGLDVGYARNGYFPRHYDRHRAHSDKAGFKTAAEQLYSKMFNDELGVPGSDPQALLEKWTTMPRETRALQTRALASDPDLPTRMQELNQNLRRQREIEENPSPTPAETAELNQLKIDAKQLAIDNHDTLRGHIAEINADSWHANLTGGGLADFDTGAPTGKYLQARVLPPEADIIMRNYMEQDPDVAIPAYFHSVARRVAYAERFGAEGQVLKEATDKLARIDGMDGHDTTKFMTLVADITGRNQTNGGMSIFTQIPHNAAFAAGTMVLMERAMWASLHEPIAASMVTGDFRAGLATWGRSVGQLIGTASAKDRTALAEFLGVVTSPMHDTTMLSRMGADYSDSPRMQRMLQNFYKTTWLTQVTNGQRAATVGTSNWFLSKLSQNLLDAGTDTAAGHGRDNAARWFRELGLPDSIHKDFAQWMVDLNGALPTPEMLGARPGQAGLGTNINVGMSDAYSLAVRRLADRIIQDPKKVDRALLANVPGIGLAFQLMSFNYSFHENVLNPALSRIGHTYLRARTEAEAAGARRVSANVQATFGTTGTVVNTLAIATSMIGAALMTGVVRQLLFAPDQLEKHAEEGDLWPYLLRMAASRSGLYGKYDPLQQTFNHLKYDSDLASMMHGASINWFAKNLQDLFTPLLGTKGTNAPGTNTAEFNQARAAYNLIGVPAAAIGLTAMGTFGPVSRILAGVALQGGTSPQAANLVAGAWAGPKGATLPTPGAGGRGMPTLPKLGGGMPPLPKLGGGGAAKPADTGAGFTGLVGDVAIPAIGYIVPQLSTAAKIGAVGAGAAYGVYEANKAVAPFRNLPKPPPRKRPGQ